MPEPMRGRFAPTPSGRMHLGNVFCALLCWLSARAAGGRVVLRIEDLDVKRCPAERENAALLLEDLRWLGLEWDEGAGKGGPAGTYYQSARSDIYGRYLEVLREKGLIYPCFCSRAELHAAQAPHQSDGAPVYAGRCRSLSAQQVRLLCAKRRPALRLRVPDEELTFEDGMYGAQRCQLRRDCGDFIVRRSDGVYAYQLAVVVDDACMGVTQVVRGRDLLSSTPRQLYLYRTLGLKAPSFVHIPMLLAPDGRRLSKRDMDLDMGRLRESRRGPEPILGALAALCGLLPRPEAVRAQELIPLFSWEKLPKEDILLPPGFLQ